MLLVHGLHHSFNKYSQAGKAPYGRQPPTEPGITHISRLILRNSAGPVRLDSWPMSSVRKPELEAHPFGIPGDQIDSPTEQVVLSGSLKLTKRALMVIGSGFVLETLPGYDSS